MPISAQQLDTWAHQGATASSSAAYASITHALTKTGSPLTSKSPSIFLQGSYGNDTNIYGDSDIDVIVLYEDTFHKDMSALSPEEQQLHATTFSPATYTWQHWRDDVLLALRVHYGTTAVTIGKKSIKVQTSHHGRPSDVIPAVQFRRYATFRGRSDLTAYWGIHFLDSSGREVINYPKYHIERGVEKNSSSRTGGRYKSTIRLFKNLRNRMNERGLLADGIAPSYFIECALHNVPDELFRKPPVEAVPAIIIYLCTAKIDSLMCQNGVTQLLGSEPTQWSKEAFATFVLAAQNAWHNW
jgi:hypothetical protein